MNAPTPSDPAVASPTGSKGRAGPASDPVATSEGPRRWRIQRASSGSAVGVGGWLVALAVLLTLPEWGTSSQMRTVVEVLSLLALAQMWNLLAGYAGMVSIGQQAFVGIGAYSVLVLADDQGLDPFVAVPFAGLAAAAISLPLALVAFRLRGGYFAIGTWVLAEVVYLLVLNNTALGGGDGRTIRSLNTYDRFAREDYVFYLALVAGLGAVAMVVLVLRSRLGLALRSIRDEEAGARGAGVDVYRTRLAVWVLAGGWTGLTGAIVYLNRLNVQPDAAFSVQWTAYMIFIVVIGGVGSTTGPIIGTLVFWVLRDQIADQGVWYLIVLGTVAVMMAILAPKGIYGLLQRIRPMPFFPVRRRLRSTGGSSTTPAPRTAP
ncbi:MAG: branched-chain amino acid ABC transporter permease [Acidimicrobiales bacterium]